MSISEQIEAVYRPVSLLEKYVQGDTLQHSLLEKAVQELYHVLEELQTSQEELQNQNQQLLLTQHSLEQERQRYQLLFDCAPGGYVVTDNSGVIQQVNQTAAAMCGFSSPFYLHRKPLLLLIHKSDRTRFQTELLSLSKAKGELLLKVRHQPPLAVAIQVIPLPATEHLPPMLLWSLHDVSSHHRLEAQLRVACECLGLRISEKTNELSEIHNKNKILEYQFLRAQRVESLGLVANGIAHDLKNVFTPILCFAQLQLMQDSPSDESHGEAWEVIQDSIQRGVDLVQDMLRFTEGNPPGYSPLPSRSFILDIAKTIQHSLPPSISFNLDMTPQPLGLISANATHIYQIVLNLCINARDAMPDGGQLTLAVDQCVFGDQHIQKQPETWASEYLMIAVGDTGVGIPPDVINNIFDPFFTTKPKGKGTGLGLATVSRIIKNHGGFIEVFSKPGQGTTFKVYFPVLTEAQLEKSLRAPSLFLKTEPS